MILDVGCGDRPRGTVNVDLNIGSSSHLDDRRCTAKIPNFVCADINHLPFKSNVFAKVLCWHTLEHLETPEKALRELVRVANGTVQVVVPHRYHEKFQNFFLPTRRAWASKHHKHFFSIRQLQELLKKTGIQGVVRCALFNKYGAAIKYYKTYKRPFLDLLLFGFVETFLPPIPGELMMTIHKTMNPTALAT